MKTTRSAVAGGALGAVYLILFALVWILGVAGGLLAFLMLLLGIVFIGSVLEMLGQVEWRRTGLGTPYRAVSSPHPAAVAAMVVILAGCFSCLVYLMLR